ncbi:Asp-tRNA(Asn)/Glu-tRNA(Gln) amidotransferase subunit GatB [Mycoplasma bradburyae]|uniref:Aspartyl/glutamyl-tRNA(Asn/Gln) amidotransferase subunit B n=1 Tax=Mycoplasma bradburyae TaxID=2963128 RepID=A0ABT5G9M6_9MOLU|nr:Asp-tRNA(Asn)/Glu-tRNA(Gln) amidotransferase subunit GatB [Mycoplasma bradburyae]MDC4181600.1 Asp-tRNA(Asn)/Glu-tRNA(Gln) amidotransferase subunit GatB [Mycoplasma bradburyae]MDC4182326.1 Asp-tRNA(Asn)/Glu-tRNA(Gln) amidotransferase subunit GatB [Mycoplasma bradburyae]MDC4183771.1 Asp-tRNA(Asn)/Glu-tRNA(Gln) amidotransferase subunit GatB [Mycoplasma bradburyae]UTS69977.1 Asp-tRNA(Asn)/Glu-tRNA(Gln) amidotransferase subunit GatB [Mycoplasma bradburyae]
MHNFQPTIGIEVHVAVNSKTKMFSPSANSHTDNPNSNVHPIDLGLPGTMPEPNALVVKKALVLAKALNMKNVDHHVRFDRKNYFYQDLPKGYQITQQHHPIATNGYVEISNKKIPIQRFHIEEDTAKQLNQDNKILLDYNRAGSPLIEIVTDPVFESGQEVKEYLTNLRRILIFNDISDAKLEEGSMRVDVNVSIRPYGVKKYGTRVEIKNINSINNVEKAINYEINRQQEMLLSNQGLIQATMRYDDQLNQTVFMREKTDAVDYRYMFEPNIIGIQLDQEFLEQTNQMPVFDIKKLESELLVQGLDKQFVDLLLDNIFLYRKLNEINSKIDDLSLVSKWLLIELIGRVNKLKLKLELINPKWFDGLSDLLVMIKNEDLNQKQAKVVLDEIIKSDETVAQIVERLNMKQIKEPGEIKALLEPILLENINVLNDYDTRKERVEKLLIGLLMKKTNGQANPNVSIKVLDELIQKHR